MLFLVIWKVQLDDSVLLFKIKLEEQRKATFLKFFIMVIQSDSNAVYES